MTIQDEEQLKKDVHIIKIENHLQTLAVVVFFLFGIATIQDLKNKIK
jgi:hypothetical protein